MAQANGTSYLMVLLVPAYRLDDGRFAIESAFAAHLHQLRERLGTRVANLVLASPSLDAHAYEQSKSSLAVIDEARDGITFVPLFRASAGTREFILSYPRIIRTLYAAVKQAKIVHSGISFLHRPFEFPALLMGRALGRPTIAITDMDNRRSARMLYETGTWTRREYMNTRLIHEPFMHLQHMLAARICSLTLMKGKQLASDYGKGRSNVKNFLDASHSAEHVMPANALHAKLKDLAEPTTPLRINYFGRLVAYKGVDHMLRALAHAKSLGLANFTFEVIGDGDEAPRLRALAESLGLGGEVVFRGAVPFGHELFSKLHASHILLAAPLKEDTPRSALDAMCSGQAVLAYDTYYYEELKDAGAGVELVPWRDEKELGQRILALADDRMKLAGLIEKGIAFARENTQEIWLERRLAWTEAILSTGNPERAKPLPVSRAAQPPRVPAKTSSDARA